MCLEDFQGEQNIENLSFLGENPKILKNEHRDLRC
jgi:hypothetical protein